ncbi:sodium channel protein Nach-like [Bradysia coprophila]|uniref:sodium channel protein Nach-like n=1 Tax=Bradysia coprophila TaxID=38358 RepID=UPI00187DBCB2|nr:sodium channel protein Nach-like [Bradysia coprophila]
MTVPDQSEFKFSRAFKQSIVQFFENTTLHGYKYLVDPKRDNFLERLAWFVVVVVALVFAVYITLLGWADFNENPTFTTLYSQKYPIWEVDFPGVTICSINRISRKAAIRYAEMLVSKDPQINISWVLDNIRNLGALTDYTNIMETDFYRFQDTLDRLDPEEHVGVNNIQKTMDKLSPNCSDLVVKCRWDAQDIDCDKIVMKRRTSEGYCCAFNYVRAKDVILSAENTQEPLRSYQTGTENGLIVVLNSTASDYFYSLRSMIGFVVGIHNARNFPDSTNGNYHQFVVPQNTETFLKLDVATVKTDNEVARYPLEKRGCLFHFEQNSKFGGRYSYADCILRCKIYNYLHLCSCVPYTLPTNFPDFDEVRNATQCNLTHLKCLSRYSLTILRQRPKKLIKGLEKELGDSIDCPDCYPLCSLSRYLVQASYSQIATKEITGDAWGIMKGVVTSNGSRDVSILRVYYPLVATLLYRCGVVYTWHEIISYFGGLLSLCIGLSTISVMEVIYFATVRLYQNFVGEDKKNKMPKMPAYNDIEIMLVKEYAHHKK